MTLKLPPHRTGTVVSPDGVAVAVQDWGAPAGAGLRRDVLLLHGFSQAHPCWLRQVDSPLAGSCRLVTYDLRGHGDSDKPAEPQYYHEGSRWADELKAVIDAAQLVRPVVVAWSYAGRILLDYVGRYGDAGLGGMVMLNATSRTAPELFGPSASLLAQTCNPDPAISLQGTRDLLRACVATPLSQEETDFMLAYNLKVPATIRALLRRPPFDYQSVLQSLRAPTWIVHGARDPIQLPAMAAYTASQVAHAELSVYENAAHMPFWEAAGRFNQDLLRFIQGLDGRA